jgi:electron transport complex protein RnfC
MFQALMNRLNRVHAFPRGIHPPHRKYTESDPIQVFSPENDLLIPLAQHIGAACEPLVKPKQEVTLGEVIADATAFVTAPIHAPASGKIAASVITAVPGGRRVPAIPIKLVNEEPAVPPGFLEQYLRTDFTGVEAAQYEPELIVDRIRSGGLVGLGGATFPTHVKLRRNPERPIDTLILNGAECEPYLTADHRLMVEAHEWRS